MYAESNVTSGRVHVLNNDIRIRRIALKIVRAHKFRIQPQRRISAIAPRTHGVAAELDITSKPGTKRKRSCRSATEKPKKA